MHPFGYTGLPEFAGNLGIEAPYRLSWGNERNRR
jgi:hypothetical protein